MSATVAIVSGASSGIGREAALALRARGVVVYAAARRDMADLAAAGLNTVPTDVTVDDSLTRLVDHVIATEGHIDILVNNAGYGSYGAVEDVPLAEARRQFDVNVFSAMRLTQLVTPHMAARRTGRIVNVSSMGGRFAMALGGWYHATKYAIEALSDALRQEVRASGIDVVVIEPGLVRTNWTAIAAAHLRETSGLGRYAVSAKNFADALDFAGQALATDPAVIGRIIAGAALTPHPRTRYRAGAGAVPLSVLLPLMPDRVRDAGLAWFFAHVPQLLGYVRR